MRAVFAGPHFSGVPSFFRGCCEDAKCGGNLGYDHAGRELSRNLDSLEPEDLEQANWEEEIERLRPLVEASDDQAILEWFIARYPKCMSLVPKRRRDSFIRGVYESLRKRFDIDAEVAE